MNKSKKSKWQSYIVFLRPYTLMCLFLPEYVKKIYIFNM